MTPKQFFEQIQVPKTWRLTGINNVQDGEVIISYGLVYQGPEKDVKIKIYFQPEPREMGGIVIKKPGFYNLLCDNKTAGELNEYIKAFML